MYSYKQLHMDYLNKNDNFEWWTLVMHGYKRTYYELMEAICTNMTFSTTETNRAWLQNVAWGRTERKLQFWKWETNHSCLQNFAWGDLNGNEYFKSRKYQFDFWDRRINVIFGRRKKLALFFFAR